MSELWRGTFRNESRGLMSQGAREEIKLQNVEIDKNLGKV